jgi:para-nitrobenzyl esterase
MGPVSDNEAPIVLTTAGKVRGVWREDSAAFLGIPFAKPPVGELRFAAPEPVEPWDGIRDAVEYGATAQRKPLAEVTAIPEPSIPGESTLNVNVFTPAPGDSDAALPVLVWVHGGAFTGGSPASPWYDGAAFNRRGIVTVTISYRLGFDGFGWIEDAPANRGMLDWLAALAWVQQNIGAFGGDAARVTIAGQSAGGGAVLALLASPKAEGLFAQAISMSGVAPDVPLEESEHWGRTLAEAAGVEPTRAALAEVPESRVLELQDELAAPPQQTGTKADPLAELKTMQSSGLRWGPVIDGDLLPRPVLEAFAGGAGANVPLVIGTTDEEFNLVTAPFAEQLESLDAAAALGEVGLPVQAAQAYVAGREGLSTADALGQFATDVMFRALARGAAEARFARGASTWLYRFSWRSPVSGRATHCLDVPFFFDCLADPYVATSAGENPPASLARDVHRSAVDFITGGRPGWPPYEVPTREVRVFDVPSTMRPDGYADVALLAAAPA